MDSAGLMVQLLNGLANASSLFMVAVGLSLIFGVTRIVNFAHGSLYMVGIYLAYSFNAFLGAGSLWSFVGAVFLASLATGVLGILIEMAVLRRLYHAPELLQLLASFALVLIISDAVLWYFGAEDLLAPPIAYIEGAIPILGRLFPIYQLVLMVLGPLILGLLWYGLHRTTWGVYVRAAQQDKEMLGALGVNQKWLYTSVFALGACLAGLGGALELPNEPANLGLDLRVVGDAFAVVVIGGMGSIVGAFLAALSIAEIKALANWLGTVQWAGFSINFSQLSLVAEFVFMMLVLMIRPWGLLGKAQPQTAQHGIPDAPLRPFSFQGKLIFSTMIFAFALVPLFKESYWIVLLQDALVAILFAVSLHFMVGLSGMHTFGHAVYFGFGAYVAALLHTYSGLSMGWVFLFSSTLSGILALMFAQFCSRLSGIYLAMLTLAFAQLMWTIIFQWDGVTGGSNGMVGIWPSGWLEQEIHYYYFSLTLVVFSILLLRRLSFSSFGYAVRASRDSVWRTQAMGVSVRQLQWKVFLIAGFFAGLAGALYVFSKGSVSPEELSVTKSVDGLVMVLLGGIQSLMGPIVGALSYTFLHDFVIPFTDYWKVCLGIMILMLILILPRGIVSLFSMVTFRRQG